MNSLLTGIVVCIVIIVLALIGYSAAWLLLIQAGNRLTKRQLGLRPGMNVIDVGCGSGRLTIPIAQWVGPTGSVLGIDIKAQRVQQAEQSGRAMGLKNVRFERTGAGEGKLLTDHFDRAVLVTVLGEMSNREAALAEIFQALKPGGILSITEGFLDPHHQSQEQIRHLARQVGFLEESYAGNHWLFTMNLLKPAIS